MIQVWIEQRYNILEIYFKIKKTKLGRREEPTALGTSKLIAKICETSFIVHAPVRQNQFVSILRN